VSRVRVHKNVLEYYSSTPSLILHSLQTASWEIVYGEERLQNIILKKRLTVEREFYSKPLHEKLRDEKTHEFKKHLDDIADEFWNLCKIERVSLLV